MAGQDRAERRFNAVRLHRVRRLWPTAEEVDQIEMPITYSDAGVDIDAATRATDKIKELARRTFNSRTLSEIGSFGGMFDGAFPGLKQPVLVAPADGVGTKLKIAFLTGVHDTVGHDLVNHCVNDILVQGAH